MPKKPLYAPKDFGSKNVFKPDLSWCLRLCRWVPLGGSFIQNIFVMKNYLLSQSTVVGFKGLRKIWNIENTFWEHIFMSYDHTNPDSCLPRHDTPVKPIYKSNQLSIFPPPPTLPVFNSLSTLSGVERWRHHFAQACITRWECHTHQLATKTRLTTILLVTLGSLNWIPFQDNGQAEFFRRRPSRPRLKRD